jgi:polyferredoxin
MLLVWFLVRTKLLRSLGAEVRPAPAVNLFLKLDPLAAVVNILAGHAIYRGLAWALVILVPTLFLGRFFCGWICPMGSLNHLLANLRFKGKRSKAQIASNRYSKWQTTKYFVLLAGLVAALFGSSMLGWIDPFSLLMRSAGLPLLPTAAGKKYFVVYLPHYWLGALLGAAFLALLAMNQWVTRFWCRVLCPLGALLGVAAQWSILGLHKDEATCNQCCRCLIDCQGGDDPIGGAPWHKVECHLCLNCVEACPQRSLKFSLFDQVPGVNGPNLGRRKTMAGVVAGMAAVPVLYARTVLSARRNELLIRPPGALEEAQFLARCIRCGECMRVCPNDALQPTFSEGGLLGLWSPALTPIIGYCEPSCVLCTEVCPTGAIAELTVLTKGWVTVEGEQHAPVRLGTALYDRARCLPWAKATDCVVCLEWCPVSPKAIYVENVNVADAEGHTRTLKQPYVDNSRCVGCGACEYACPIQERPAVHMISVGESRSIRR